MSVALLLLRKYWLHLVAIAAVIVLLWWVYAQGKESVQKDWDASVARGVIEVAKLKEKQSVVTTKVETVYVDRVKTIREKGDVVIQKVTEYIPADSCSLPVGYRLLHDAAAKGVVPDPIDDSDVGASRTGDSSRRR